MADRPARYFAPAFPAAALAAAWSAGALLESIADRRVRVGVSGLAIVVVLGLTLPAYGQRMAVDRGRWNYADVDALAAFLGDHGVGHDAVHLAVRGGLCDRGVHGDRGQRLDELLLAGLRALGDGDLGPPSDRPPPTYLVTKLANVELPRLPANAHALASGERHTIVLVPHAPLVDLAAARQCLEFEASPPVCTVVTPQPSRLDLRQVLPRHALPDLAERGQPKVVRYEFPLRSQPAADRRARLSSTRTRPCRPWTSR